jgi:hypothetical protein
MLLTLALIVLCSAIIVFFSDEFAGLIKKFFSIPGFKLVIPLIFASLLIEAYEDWGLWLLLWFQKGIHQVVYKFATFMPFETGAVLIVRILFLFLAASVPLWISNLRAKRLGRRYPDSFTFWLGLTLWLIAIILLTVAV